MDVSFISATLVLPAVVAAALPESSAERHGRQIVVLVKPQFEVGREQVGKGGIVRDEKAQLAAVEKVRNELLALECLQTEVVESPILGAEGNREFLLRGVF
jgi:23S rRNA (cytidine1920-2'-O)/16S rRNA (cytidine1409-2'-O)-methyltransferase